MYRTLCGTVIRYDSIVSGRRVGFVQPAGDTWRDASGAVWRVSENALTREDRTALPRYTAHRAFWFGWHAQYPETLLIGDSR